MNEKKQIRFLVLCVIYLIIIFIGYMITRPTPLDTSISVPQDYVYPSSKKWQYTPENEIFIGKEEINSYE